MGLEAGLVKRFWIVAAIVVASFSIFADRFGLPLRGASEQSVLDAFMKKVVAKRDDNWK